jgi:ribonuclease H / adenosylcobalamin/alpha-ribazole phosphatase
MSAAHDIWLVRHAPTTWTGRRWCGRADPPLSRDGHAVAREVAARLAADLPTSAIIRSSPARRARSTARAIGAAAGIAVSIEPELVEVDVGRVEGLTWGEVSTREPSVAAAIGRGDPIDWPGGESSVEVAERARRAAARIRSDAAGGPVVVVSHGAFLHALLAVLVEPEAGTVLPPGHRSPVAPLQAGGIVRLVPRRSTWAVA